MTQVGREGGEHAVVGSSRKARQPVRTPENPVEKPAESLPLIDRGRPGEGDHEHSNRDADKVESRTLALLDENTGCREQSQPERGEDKGGQQCPGGERLRSA